MRSLKRAIDNLHFSLRASLRTALPHARRQLGLDGTLQGRPAPESSLQNTFDLLEFRHIYGRNGATCYERLLIGGKPSPLLKFAVHK
jgi:hypothetical protein